MSILCNGVPSVLARTGASSGVRRWISDVDHVIGPMPFCIFAVVGPVAARTRDSSPHSPHKSRTHTDTHTPGHSGLPSPSTVGSWLSRIYGLSRSLPWRSSFIFSIVVGKNSNRVQSNRIEPIRPVHQSLPFLPLSLPPASLRPCPWRALWPCGPSLSV